MKDRGSSKFLTILLSCIFASLSPVIVSSTIAAERQLKASPQKTGTEVTLMSVFFRDPNLGWAVGSGGTVLKTTDGGQKWKKQASGTSVQLTGVYFADDKHGWITAQDGVILRTEDGGKTWQKQESNAFHVDRDPNTGKEIRNPLYLFGLWVLDKDHAWAVGDRSILTSTVDGGGKFHRPARRSRFVARATRLEWPAPAFVGRTSVLVVFDGLGSSSRRRHRRPLGVAVLAARIRLSQRLELIVIERR